MGMGLSPAQSPYLSLASQIKDAVITEAKLSSGTLGQSGLYINPAGYDSIVQGTWAYINLTDAGGVQNAFFINTSHANNDELRFTGFLGKGTYSCFAYGWGGTDEGILDVEIGGTSVGTMDFYNAGGTACLTRSITGITVTSSGVKTIDLLVNSKNAGSSDYYMGLVNVIFRATA